MSFKKISLAAIAALCLPAAQAFAVPALSLVDNGGGSATLSVVLDALGAIGAEVTIEGLDGLTLVDATINDAASFDEANPGNHPWAASAIGGNTSGIETGFIGSDNGIFAAYGGPGDATGTLGFLDITYTGTGTLSVGGYVAQGGVLGDELMASIMIGGAGLPGDANGDGKVDPADAAILGANWLMNVGGGAADGDFNGDGLVDPADAAILGGNWLAMAAPEAGSAAPEPAAIGLVFATLGGFALRRRSR